MKKRFGQMIKVKPEKLAEYKKWHANPMPGVNEMIKECGLKNYSIYSRGEYLFTYFEYEGEDFDADMAKLVGEKLGVEVDFVEIDWDNKVMELNSKNIDVVWNGMTLTDEVTSSMECTNAYCNNAQVVVVPEGK